MDQTIIMLILLLSFVYLLGCASAFSPAHNNNNNNGNFRVAAQLQAVKQVTLNLGASIDAESSSLPVKDEINVFLKENWGLLISAGGKRAYSSLKVTDELRSQYKQQCETVKVTPSDDFEVVSVITGSISFPGLALTSCAKIGVQASSENKYEFVFIGDTREVKGSPPIVWIYNKLTGSGGTDDNNSSSDGSNAGPKSLTSVTYRISEKNNTVVFQTETFLEIMVSFPALLMKILPTNKEKAEEQGASAIKKTLEKDVIASMKAFEEAYKSYAPSASNMAN